MPQLLSPVLSRWDLEPPMIYAPEADGPLREVFSTLHDLAVVRPVAPVAAADCSECSTRCTVTYLVDVNRNSHAFIHCPDCGIERVPERRLKRWEIDTAAMLTVIFRGAGLTVQERVHQHVWLVGKANWAGRLREVWFARAYRRGRVAEAVSLLRSHPKSVVFAPTELAAQRWHEATGNLVLAIDGAVTLDSDGIHFDSDYVEGRIIDAGMGQAIGAKRPTKKRGDRAAKIESLEDELIKHLRAARDHACWSKERTGTPELLPRPSQTELGVRTAMSKWDVSRCLGDPDARELRVYWETAADLDQILRWSGNGKRSGSNRRRPPCQSRQDSGTMD